MFILKKILEHVFYSSYYIITGHPILFLQFFRFSRFSVSIMLTHHCHLDRPFFYYGFSHSTAKTAYYGMFFSCNYSFGLFRSFNYYLFIKRLYSMKIYNSDVYTLLLQYLSRFNSLIDHYPCGYHCHVFSVFNNISLS